jgi:hypothetical protein
VKKAARASATYEMVRQTALSLPNVKEGTAWGYPAFRASGKIFLCFRKDLDAVSIRVPFDQRDEMIEASPETYFTTEHYENYPWVLVHIKMLDPSILLDLVRIGWKTVRSSKR